MDLMVKPNADKLNPMTRSDLDSMELPNFRFMYAQQQRTIRNILIKTPYALGDCVCAEPAIRYATQNLEGCTVSIHTSYPELFRHLPIKTVYNTKDKSPDWEQYYVMECYHAAQSLQSQFVHNFNMPIEDYIATSLFKGVLPVADRNIILEPTQIELMPSKEVVIHAGKHWVSKTFPKKWWDAVIAGLVEEDVKPVLIGAKVGDGKRGYVDVDSAECEDWRDKLTVMQSVSALQNADVVLTNDSAPLHMASSGTAWIGFFSTVRHPDFITHWRPNYDDKNEWAWKMENLALGQMWQNTDVSPTKLGSKYDVIDFKTLMSWLPEPDAVVEWTMNKLTNNTKGT